MSQEIKIKLGKHKIKIRPAKRKDRHAIKEVNEKCLAENYDVEYIENNIAFKNSFIAHEKSLTTGYILCNNLGHIVSFAVIPDFRKLGLGRQLLNLCLSNLENKKKTLSTLNVRTDNTVAINLYESLGYKTEKTSQKYYADGTDAYFMKKNLLLTC